MCLYFAQRYSSVEWELDEVLQLKDYKVSVFVNVLEPVIAIDVSSPYSYLTTSFFDLTELCKMEHDPSTNEATLVAIGYLIDSVLDEYEQSLKNRK